MNKIFKQFLLLALSIASASLVGSQTFSSSTSNIVSLKKERYCDPANNIGSISKVKNYENQLKSSESNEIIQKHNIANKINEEMRNFKCVDKNQ